MTWEGDPLLSLEELDVIHSNTSPAAAFLSWMALVVLEALGSAQGGEPKKVEVSIEQIQEGTVVIVGSLGRPIGEFMKLQGSWAERLKGSNLQMVITHLDGKRLQRPVHFQKFFVHSVDKHDRPVAPLKGDVWEMDAYESCDFHHIEPDQFQRALGRWPNGAVQDPFAGFHCELYVIVTKSKMRPDLQWLPTLSDPMKAIRTEAFRQGGQEGKSVSPILPPAQSKTYRPPAPQQ